jgi:hypothetical protein
MEEKVKKIIAQIKNSSNPFLPFFIIFFSVISYLLVISFLPINISYSVKKNELKSYFSEINRDKEKELLASQNKRKRKKKTSPKLETSQVNPVKLDTSAQRILIFGDSMLDGLGPRLDEYCEENGHKLCAVIWYSSNTNWYANTDTIPYYIKKFKPTYIILAIGSGDIQVWNCAEARKPQVEKILEQVGDIPYIWVGPPNWKEDTGINKLIETSVDEGSFFLSKNLKFDRQKDGVHPTVKSASNWMDTICTFIMKESIHPIKLNVPTKKRPRRWQAFLIKPKPPINLKRG